MSFRKTAVIFLFISIAITSVFALTSGPVQPEFTSFEPVDVTDLVNLPTGDFTYVLPLGAVKGPEGVGYPVTLSYHAGIRNEQEASWVGLGWTLNAGAINRQVVCFPDDYFRSSSSSYVVNAGEHNTENTFGIGWFGCNTEWGWCDKGFEGVVGMGYGTKIGSSNVTVGIDIDARRSAVSLSVGYSFDGDSKSSGAAKDEGNGNIAAGVTFAEGETPTYFVKGGVGIGPISVATFSMDSKGNSSTSLGGFGGRSLSFGKTSNDGLKQYASAWGIGFGCSFGSISYSSVQKGWNFQQMKSNKGYGYIYHSPNLENTVETFDPLLPYFSENNVYNQTWRYTQGSPAHETSFSPLGMLAKSAGSGSGVTPAVFGGRDNYISAYINVATIDDKLEYVKCQDMNLPAQDMYQVTGQGISGMFRPFARYALQSCYSSDEKIDGKFDKTVAGGVPDAFNKKSMYVSQQYKDGLVFKMVSETSFNLIDTMDLPQSDYATNDLLNIGDGYFYDQASTTVKHDVCNVTGTVITPLFSNGSSDHRLTGFIVTDQEGKKYYYTLPLFNIQQISYSSSNPNGLTSKLVPDNGSYSYVNSNSPYVSTWLLTAITGSDYVKMKSADLPEPGTHYPIDFNWILPHQGDMGYWVKFNYAYDDYKTSENIEQKSTYLWQNPYKLCIHDQCAGQYSTTLGQKEITYLSSIETPSEVAYFHTEDRDDGIGLEKTEYPDLSDVALVNSGDMFKKESFTSLKGVFNESNKPFSDIYETTLILKNKGTITIPKFNGDKTSDPVVARQDAQNWWDAIKDGEDILLINIKGEAYWVKGGIKIPFCFAYPGEKYAAKGAFIVMKATQTQNPPPNWVQASRYLGAKICKVTKYIKCTGYTIKNNADGKTVDVELAVETYENGKDEGQGSDFVTGLLKGQMDIKKPKAWCADHIDEDSPYSNFEIESSVLAFTSFINTRAPVRSVQKRLKEIVWYSKTASPFISGKLDPGTVAEIMANMSDADKTAYQNLYTGGLPLPSYNKRVVFGYSYDLAKNTPNTTGGTDNPKKGRLTLRSVTMEGEGGTRLPPFTFQYQHESVPYDGPETGDQWGFPPGGPHWNLSKINLPSGGSIAIDYGRDSAYTSYSIIRDLKSAFPCAKGQISPEVLNLPSFPATYNNAGKIVVTGLPSGSISVGDYLIVHSSHRMLVGGPDILNYRFVYKVTGITGAELSIDHPIKFPWDAKYNKSVDKIFVLKQKTILGDGVRVTKITANSGFDEIYTKYSYPEAGVMNLLPATAVPEFFLKSYGSPTTNGNVIDYAPYSDITEYNYNDGNLTIIYPVVEVATVRKDGTTINGKERYEFWTYDDNVPIYGASPVPVVNYVDQHYSTGANGTEIDTIRQIWDHSGIVGMLKKMKSYDNSNNVIFEKENTYAFSEELHNRAHVKTRYGVDRSAEKQPIGLVRQRSIKVDKDGKLLNVADIILSKPFLLSTTQTTRGVTTQTSYDMFDAATGLPLFTRTANKKSATETEYKLDRSIPFMELVDEENRRELVKSNVYNLMGGSITGEIPSADFPSTLMGSIDPDSKIGCKTFIGETMDNPAVFIPQKRYYAWQDFSWIDKNSTFHWSLSNANGWIKNSEVAKVDWYTRVRTVINAKNIPTTLVYHPKMEAITGSISNSKYYESSVLTCDYNDINPEYPLYLDYNNGWEKKQSVITDEENHFGEKCVKVVSPGWGPTANFLVTKDKNYILSAWVKVTRGTAYFAAEFREKQTAIPANKWPLLESELKTVGDPFANADLMTIPAKATPAWEYKEMKIHTKEKLIGNPGYIRVEIGCPGDGTVYIDDMRLFPENSLVSTNYYSPQYGLPVAMVDANNKAKYFEYDAFGRLSHIYNNARVLTKSAVYHTSGVMRQLKLTSPVFGQIGMVGIGLPIKWSTTGTVNNVKLSYSKDKETWTTIVACLTNSGSYTWVIPASLLSDTDYWVKIEDVTAPEIVYDISDAAFRNKKYMSLIKRWTLKLFEN